MSWSFAAATVASFLPHRTWAKRPDEWPVESAAVLSGILTVLAGAAIGIPGFLDHAAQVTSLGTNALIAQAMRGHEMSVPEGYAGLSIFSFLLLTPKGWLTSYLLGTGALRGLAAWFDDPIGDPILTGIDEIVCRTRARTRERRARDDREALEGPEVMDDVLSGTAANLPGCDLVIVSSRRKDGWDRGVAVFTNETCYRLGEPVERTIAGRLRTLYPLTEHRDLEAIRRSVHYDLPRTLPR